MLGLDAERQPGQPGVWFQGKKIASIGVHISRGITSHGFALNVSTDLSYFSHIVPCGLPDVSMTSIANERGSVPQMTTVMSAAVEAFSHIFEVETVDLDAMAPAQAVASALL
jgi:lipoate-protein ligase B